MGSKVKPTSESYESVLADGCMAFAALGQMYSMLLATYFITKAVTGAGDELMNEREEHVEVVKLRADEQGYNEAYAKYMVNLQNVDALAYYSMYCAAACNV